MTLFAKGGHALKTLVETESSRLPQLVAELLHELPPESGVVRVQRLEVDQGTVGSCDTQPVREHKRPSGLGAFPQIYSSKHAIDMLDHLWYA